ncbi:YciI family protein [Pseudactinotalea suaedae]|uniref:YciI family protein n=1 Tax=Pseudactinotalea suaedae TaxID=1524924 RepID=UPI0012E0FDF9|nr:YciI family protein [Pseudactinotalea suaedae]
MSKYLLLITTDTSVPASEEDRAQAPDVEAWWQSVVDSGRYVTGDPLQPASQAVTVRVRGGKVRRTEGPFTEAGEVIAGLDVIEADSMAEAIQVAAGHPMAWTHAVEVREFVSMG